LRKSQTCSSAILTKLYKYSNTLNGTTTSSRITGLTRKTNSNTKSASSLTPRFQRNFHMPMELLKRITKVSAAYVTPNLTRQRGKAIVCPVGMSFARKTGRNIWFSKSTTGLLNAWSLLAPNTCAIWWFLTRSS
jgi:hypothetical protein